MRSRLVNTAIAIDVKGFMTSPLHGAWLTASFPCALYFHCFPYAIAQTGASLNLRVTKLERGHKMHAQKTTKTNSSRARAMPMIDRGREEKLLLQNWAVSDLERFLDDLDSDEDSDQQLRMELANVRPGVDRFDA